MAKIIRSEQTRANTLVLNSKLRKWVSGLLTADLVRLWEVISHNEDTSRVHPRNLHKDPYHSPPMLVKTEEASGPLSGIKPAVRVGLYKHRSGNGPQYQESGDEILATDAPALSRSPPLRLSDRDSGGNYI